ncbi:MAG: serine hydrolase, partial [Sphingomonadales bacterium]
DGKILLDKGYGSANLEWKIANDGDTKFRLGSVTKQFTATAILLLAERGKVSLDGVVKTYLPDAPASWDKVTVRNLLNHSAGIPNFTSFDDYGKTKALATTPTELIARFRDKPLDFAPGERMDYSNSGYVVLTAIVEKVSGQPYGTFVADNIFKPLGMADSGYDSPKTVLARRASGYSPSPDGVINADYLDMTVPQGAGGLYSTTHDLLKWQAALFGGKVLKPESFTAYTTPYKNNYALGVMVAKADGKTSIEHSGGIDGFNTWLGYDPDSKVTVIVLANLNGGAASALGKSMMTLGRGGAVTLPSERKAIAVAPATAREYVGEYELTPTFGIVVRYEGGKLTAQATNQAALELFAEKPDFFFYRATDAQIAFTRDASGKVTGAVLHQAGRQMPVKKK